MSLLDARQLGETTELSAEVCVVGAGAAGITLATELADSGLDVMLLEAGGRRADAETQSLYDMKSVGYPIREDFMSRARYFGGSCNLWAGRCMKLAQADLAGREWIADSGWPIAYQEIEEVYPQAARILGLPNISMFEAAVYRDRLSTAERELFDAPDLTPTVSLWAPRPKRFGNASRRYLKNSQHVCAILHANAIRLELAPEGRRMTAVLAGALEGGRFRVRARVFVLACGGIENARLLLASDDVQQKGIGNRHDLVGRYFMDHPRTIFGSVRLQGERPVPLLSGRPLPDGKVHLGIGLSEEARRREGLLSHYATFEATYSQYAAQRYESLIQTMKVLLRRGYAGSRADVGRAKPSSIPGLIYLLTPKELMPHRVYRWYVRVKDALRRDRGPVERTVVYFCEQPPNAESRVQLRRERDALGVPLTSLDWRIESEVVRSVLQLQDLVGARLRETGVGELSPGEGEPSFSDASHHLGTTRMSEDPKRGAVDPNCRVHDVENLYVAGSSVFPSAGHANPTLTIIALALRLAKHLRGRPDLAR